MSCTGRLVEAGATRLAIDALSSQPERQVEALTELLLPQPGTRIGRGDQPLPVV